MYDFDEHRKSLKNWLRGRNYFTALKAMQIAQTRHVGVRKDGKTPELMHQVILAQHARTLEPSLTYPEETIAVLLLHDLKEDIPDGRKVVEAEFDGVIAAGVEAMSKFYYPHHAMEKSDEHYYGALAESEVGCIAKGIDRCHNLQSMQGVFDLGKQQRYIGEVEDHIMPMLSKAKENFPQQELAIHNIKHTLLCQLDLIRHVHAYWQQSMKE